MRMTLIFLMIAAFQAPAAPTITRAVWTDGKLIVLGSGATAGSVVTIRDSDTHETLNRRGAQSRQILGRPNNRSGTFKMLNRLAAVPCSVIATDSMGTSAPVDVESDVSCEPPAVSMAAPTIDSAAWIDTRGGTVSVDGTATPGATVRVIDTATGMLVGEGTAQTEDPIRPGGPPNPNAGDYLIRASNTPISPCAVYVTDTSTWESTQHAEVSGSDCHPVHQVTSQEILDAGGIWTLPGAMAGASVHFLQLDRLSLAPDDIWYVREVAPAEPIVPQLTETGTPFQITHWRSVNWGTDFSLEVHVPMSPQAQPFMLSEEHGFGHGASMSMQILLGLHAERAADERVYRRFEKYSGWPLIVRPAEGTFDVVQTSIGAPEVTVYYAPGNIVMAKELLFAIEQSAQHLKAVENCSQMPDRIVAYFPEFAPWMQLAVGEATTTKDGQWYDANTLNTIERIQMFAGHETAHTAMFAARPNISAWLKKLDWAALFEPWGEGWASLISADAFPDNLLWVNLYSDSTTNKWPNKGLFGAGNPGLEIWDRLDRYRFMAFLDTMREYEVDFPAMCDFLANADLTRMRVANIEDAFADFPYEISATHNFARHTTLINLGQGDPRIPWQSNGVRVAQWHADNRIGLFIDGLADGQTGFVPLSEIAETECSGSWNAYYTQDDLALRPVPRCPDVFGHIWRGEYQGFGSVYSDTLDFLEYYARVKRIDNVLLRSCYPSDIYPDCDLTVKDLCDNDHPWPLPDIYISAYSYHGTGYWPTWQIVEKMPPWQPETPTYYLPPNYDLDPFPELQACPQ